MLQNVPNITIQSYDNGKTFYLCIDEITVAIHNTLYDTWKHIEWIYNNTNENVLFTIGNKHTPVDVWIRNMYNDGKL